MHSQLARQKLLVTNLIPHIIPPWPTMKQPMKPLDCRKSPYLSLHCKWLRNVSPSSKDTERLAVPQSRRPESSPKSPKCSLLQHLSSPKQNSIEPLACILTSLHNLITPMSLPFQECTDNWKQEMNLHLAGSTWGRQEEILPPLNNPNWPFVDSVCCALRCISGSQRAEAVELVG